MRSNPALHSNTIQSDSRLNYLDAVRTFALLLGIVLHACLSYLPMDIGWVVMDKSTSPLVSSFAFISHSFRMEVFFLIAGFFSHMTFHRSGASSFMKSRAVRIGLPLLVGWLILRPFIISAWIVGHQRLNGEVDVIAGIQGGYGEFFDGLPGRFLTETHLWFLYYLLLSTAFVLTCRQLLLCNEALYTNIASKLDSFVFWISKSRLSFFILCPPAAFCLWFMRDLGLDTPDKSLIPHWPVFGVYCGFFVLGWLLHRMDGLIDHFSRLTAGCSVFCIASIICSLGFSEYFNDADNENHFWLRLGGVLSYAGMMWSLVIIAIGSFRVLFNRPNEAIRYLADASYWLYLIHLPIVVWLQVALVHMPYHWSIKLAMISLITIGFSIVVYDLMVRSTWIGKILNGRKKEPVVFKGVKAFYSKSYG